jgi:hypothetical protein
VIAARSGVVNFLEGVVFVDGQPLDRKPGVFVRLQEGSVLSTEGGRAELLLTPDTYLRLGADSSIRMISTDIDDTKVEMLTGSAILDSAQAPAGAFVKIVFKGETIRPLKPGNYRLDVEPPQLRVFKGQAEVSPKEKKGDPVTVAASQLMPLDGSSVVKRFTEGTDSLLDIWSDERGALIASNMINSQSIHDPLFDTGPAVPDDLASYIGYGSALPPAPGGMSTYGSTVVYPTYSGIYTYPGYPGYPGLSVYTPYPSLATALLIPGYRRQSSLLLYAPHNGYSSVFTARPGYTGYSGGIGVSSPGRTVFAPRPVTTVGPHPVTVAPHVGTPVRAVGHR